MNNLVEIVFQNELTKNGLDELRNKYPSDLVVDMSSDEEFKQARKTRTEMNKLVDAINRRRIDVSSEIKSHGDSLIKQVEEIYSVVVQPFEIEDKRRKEIAAEEKRKYEEKILAERQQIQQINLFVSDCSGKSSEYIQGVIESVDLIETDGFHKDLIHEAIQVKKNTLDLLSNALQQAIINEQAEEQRKAAEAQVAEMRAQMEAMQSQLAAQQAAKYPEPEQPVAEQVKTPPEPLQGVKQGDNSNQELYPLVDAINDWVDKHGINSAAHENLLEMLNNYGIDV